MYNKTNAPFNFTSAIHIMINDHIWIIWLFCCRLQIVVLNLNLHIVLNICSLLSSISLIVKRLFLSSDKNCCVLFMCIWSELVLPFFTSALNNQQLKFTGCMNGKDLWLSGEIFYTFSSVEVGKYVAHKWPLNEDLLKTLIIFYITLLLLWPSISVVKVKNKFVYDHTILQ